MSDNQRAPKKITINYQNGKIYKIANDLNDCIYIGSTTQPLAKRLSSHKSRAKTLTTNFYSAMREIGTDHFKIILIELFACTSKAELDAREYALISTFPKEMVYNSFINGAPDAEVRKKMSEKMHESPAFKRGSISQYKDKCSWCFRFQWCKEGKNCIKQYSYGTTRTREMAYMAILAFQESIYPITNWEYLQELPFMNE